MKLYIHFEVYKLSLQILSLAFTKPQIIQPLQDNITFFQMYKVAHKTGHLKIASAFSLNVIAIRCNIYPLPTSSPPVFVCNVISLQNVVTKLHLVLFSTSILRNVFALLSAHISPTERNHKCNSLLDIK